MTYPKLKPCPFCGGKAICKSYTKKQGKAHFNGEGDTEIKDMPNRWVFLGCETDGCILGTKTVYGVNKSSLFFRFGSKKEAIEKWNKRAGEEE